MNANATSSIHSVIIEADYPSEAEEFVRRAFGLEGRVDVGATQDRSSGFRGFSLSLVFEQPSQVDRAAAAAIAAGATELKPVRKSFWGYGGSILAPDGTNWTLASSAKKDTGDPGDTPAQLVVLAGVADVAASKAFYTDHGLAVRRGYGSKYVEFDTGEAVTLAIQSRRAVAKNAGIDTDGSGSHRLILRGTLGSVVDPDGYAWE